MDGNIVITLKTPPATFTTPAATDAFPVSTIGWLQEGFMQFSELPIVAPLQKALAEIGFTTPTTIQASALPLGLLGRDVIGTANTGTGKTVAFVLPVLQRLLSQPAPRRRTRALILTPTRELAEQIHQTIRQLGRYTNVRSACVYGGVSMYPQERALREGVEIIVACPGRLLDHLQRGNAQLGHVEVFVLDEADRMMDMGFMPSVKRIMAELPRERQTMLFSATFAPELEQLATHSLKDPARVDAGVGVAARTVAHALYPVPHRLKTMLLLEILRRMDTESVLIFTRTKHRADRLVQQMDRAGYDVAVLHSGRSQSQRRIALEGFRTGQYRLLVATDIAARGLDIDSISHVVNYDIPDTSDTYIHRIGRTGRAEREGDAFTLVTNDDEPIVRDIERTLKSRIERRRLEGFDYDQPTSASDSAAHSTARSHTNGRGRSGRSEGGRGDGGWSEGGRSEGGRFDGGRYDGGRSEGGRSDSRHPEGSWTDSGSRRGADVGATPVRPRRVSGPMSEPELISSRPHAPRATVARSTEDSVMAPKSFTRTPVVAAAKSPASASPSRGHVVQGERPLIRRVRSESSTNPRD